MVFPPFVLPPRRRAALVVLAAALGLGSACASRGAITAQPASTAALASTFDAAYLRLLDDYARWLGPVEVRLGRKQRATLSVEVEQGWCYAVFAVADPRLLDLDMVVTRANGQPAGRDDMFDATPYVQYCADDSVPLDVTLIAARGRGEIALGVLRKPY